MTKIILIEKRPANQVDMEKKFIRMLLEQWDGEGSFIKYLMITLPVMWAGYVRLN